MPNDRQLAIESVFFYQSIRRAEQRGVTQTEGLLGDYVRLVRMCSGFTES